MAIKIEMLRCFQAVADQGSLADAAEDLGRTTSAVSMMLKQFEDQIGAPLFETARKSRLTPLGKQIYAEALRELSHFDRTILTIGALSRAQLGYVRLVATPSLAQSILPPILQQFLLDHPRVHLNLSDMDSNAVLEEMKAEKADIGMASVPANQGCDSKLLFSDRFGVICRSDHDLAARGELTWNDLADETLIANGLCSLIRDPELHELLDDAQLTVRNTASLMGLVNAGIGVTILPELALSPGFPDLAFVPLAAKNAKRDVWLITQPRQLLTPVARELANAIAKSPAP